MESDQNLKTIESQNSINEISYEPRYECVQVLLLSQMVSLLSRSEADHELSIKQALGLVSEIKPKDGIENLLAHQMAAVHCHLMKQSEYASKAANLFQSEKHTSLANKLADTFTKQIEALTKYRGHSQQNFTFMDKVRNVVIANPNR